MSKSQKPIKSQSECFIEAAREAECSEDEAVFDEALRRIAKAKPQKAKPKKKGPVVE
jgi:hypothetical protein